LHQINLSISLIAAISEPPDDSIRLEIALETFAHEEAGFPRSGE
jgi:hypothetical protein